jgi:hypothetical protein
MKEQLNNNIRTAGQPTLENMKLFQEINLSSCKKNVNLFVFYFYLVMKGTNVAGLNLRLSRVPKDEAPVF